MDIATSERMKKYFESNESEVQRAFSLARKAREQNYDPAQDVEIKLAKNLAERVVGLISVIAPQIVDTKIVERIVELEKQYGNQDWRVAMIIAHEVAQQKYCSFDNELEAMEVGIRIGFAYVTVGVVSSPIEGFTKLELIDRRDGKGKYFCMHFAGPIRNAGGTAAATSVIIADYVRKHMGFAKYDPDEKECDRCYTEIMDYHERVTNLQYVPSKEESNFMVANCPIEINGDASEKFEVSNFKDLPRVHTNKIRSGFCLIHSSCLPLKAPKLWKQVMKWHEDMDMSDWTFLEKFIEIQHEAKARAKGSKKKKEKSDDKKEEHKKVSPIFTYISDLVGGRPVISHPLRSGGMRLRYGRSRTSGFSAQSIHPASMFIMDNFVAIGTQLKVERPGKAAAMTSCDTVEGPRVLLKNGDVVYITTVEQAKALHKEVKEILYVGDVLINYGDFFDRAHPLIPAGYCEEWWGQEVEKVLKEKPEVLSSLKQIDVNKYINDPIKERPTLTEAIAIAKHTQTALHPYYTQFFNEISKEQLILVKNAVQQGMNKFPHSDDLHRAFCLLGIPLTVRDGHITIDDDAFSVLEIVLRNVQTIEGKTNVETINETSELKIKDRSGTFIGARMGRPEKGKMRKLSTSPHGLFPVSEQGGRLRSFQSCVENGFVHADMAAYKDNVTGKLSCLPRSHHNDEVNVKINVSRGGLQVANDDPSGETHCTMRQPFPEIFEYCRKKLQMNVAPDLIKGVQGTVNGDHYVEHPAKAMLRAHHGIFVNKDGTVRYDASEIPITHFKPKEIGTSVTRLKELGYTHDCYGKPLEHEDQVCEIIPQDILLPCCPESLNEPADEVLYNVTKFIDDLLVKLYGVEPYYNLASKHELVGHLIIGLAPHTSAGTIGRIIGFSKSQAMFCHPLFHAANRRDCDGDELCYLLMMDAFLNFSTHYLPSSRGGTMDAPLVLTSMLDPSEVDDMAFNLDVAWTYPLELYEAGLEMKMPWDIKIHLLGDDLKTPQQFEGMGFTHDTTDLNDGVLVSAYKILPSMQDKVQGQMGLAEKIRAVDQDDTARIVVQTHFIRDTRGNLRKYSMQEFRCVKCNTKYRRPPLPGVCTQEGCIGKIVGTISEGSVVKYLEPSLSLSTHYHLPSFLHQSLELTKLHIEGLFGKEKEKQAGLGEWF